MSSKNYFTVALLQLLPEGSIEGNMKKGLNACRKAKEMGADLALFPEMWSIGYDFNKFSNEFAVEPDSGFVRSFAEAAEKLGMAIAVTYLERHEPKPRNTAEVFDRFGNSILRYSKVHTCDFGDESALCHGDDFYTADLDTISGKVRIGAMICYDREFPESARILMLKGAEIILVPNACPMEINRLSQLRARAYENMVGIATCNYPYGQPDCNGHSTTFDGIAYRPDESGSRDTLIVEAGEEEGIYLARFPLDDIREYRKQEVHGNAYRRPEKYKLLLSEEKCEPFIRNDFNK
ncbi:carbon-nitrogen hydrolase family protein [Ruminococcus sp. Marseille-P6503]|uniref:carbon-nitrogen hydrolase family protein n=1 Tax=Ruminococcus sp. Marseille-P6503 TaxID=2364796 RepID=UPI000F5210C6|nr:carbon-nitrogen hydrolase family protein [Ruminococcus sp. Marseille-P6503]